MRPLMFGYVRLELVGDRLKQVEGALRDFAAYDGFQLAEVFREEGPCTGALWRLTRAMATTASRHVITPSPTHMEGSGIEERCRLLGELARIPRMQVWYLDPDDSAVLLRTYRRNRDIPAPDTSTSSAPRSVIGRFGLRPVPRAAALARLRIHECLTRAGLLPLVEPAERVVLAVLAEATAVAEAAEPEIFARLAATNPQLSPPHNLMTVWLLQQNNSLEVQVHETVARADAPLSPPIAVIDECGRYAPAVGGTLTWARFLLPVAARASPSGATPTILHPRAAAARSVV